MKKIILYLALILMPTMTFAQDIFGKWRTDNNSAIVEVYQKGDVINAKIIWLAETMMPDGKTPVQDIYNPDKTLRERPVMGLDIIWDMVPNQDKWEGGKVYDPEHGKTYNCTLRVKNDVLKVRGSIGPFGKTLDWTRVSENEFKTLSEQK